MAKDTSAKAAKQAESLFRVVKWEIFPNPKQQSLLLEVSRSLQGTWNHFRMERVAAYHQFRTAKEAGGDTTAIKQPTLFDQINALTARRVAGHLYGPRNWHEEALDTLNGSYQSFFALIKKGDPDARSPGERHGQYFTEISGRSGFALRQQSGHATFELAPQLFGRGAMNFSIPEYCTKKLAAARVKKFTLCRTPANLNQRGRYWVSVAYELPRPQTVDSSNRNTAYLSLGASSLGVYVPFDGGSGYEEVVDLWRPDKYWLPRIEAVTKARDACTKGSRAWGKRDAARRRMYELMARQQTQDVREIVAYLLRQGFRHFVIQDYVVRSKQGKLADRQKSDRGGGLGLNWSAQNTGSIGRLAQWLEDKVIEYGGTVTRHRPTLPAPKGLRGRASKLLMARRLYESLKGQSR